MALSANVVWEVRSTGNDTNGGGFVTGASGTDWSQQDSVQYSLTDGVTNGTTTIATASASTDMVGNTAYVAGGTGSITPGWYEITAVSAGVSITVDRSTGLTTGTGVTINIGGRLASLGVVGSLAVPGNDVWLNGTFTVTSSPSFNSGDTTNGPIRILGYSSSRNDNGFATITSSTNSVKLLTAGSLNRIGNINFVHTATTRGVGTWTADGEIYNCIFTGCSSAIVAATNANLLIYGCAFLESTGSYHIEFATALNGRTLTVQACYFRHSSSTTIECIRTGRATTARISYSCFVNGAYGVRASPTTTPANLYISNCSFWNQATGGIASSEPSTTSGTLFLTNNLFYDQGGYSISRTGSASDGNRRGNTFLRYNFSGNHTSGFYNNVEAGIGDATITANPFTDPSSGDLSLNNTAGGGADCRVAGFPGGFLGGLTTGYLDIGAVQHQDSGGGGTVYKNIRVLGG